MRILISILTFLIFQNLAIAAETATKTAPAKTTAAATTPAETTAKPAKIVPKNSGIPPKPILAPAPVAAANHDNLYKEIETFSTKKLDAKKDLEEVKKTITSLLILDDEDPSRTSAMVLSESYNKNKALYDKAIKAVETPKNKQQLKELKEIMSTFSKEGNG